jgi:hypothetical protein
VKYLRSMLNVADAAWERTNSEQKKAIIDALETMEESTRRNLRGEIEEFFDNHLEDILDVNSASQIGRHLAALRRVFNLSLPRNVISQFEELSVVEWPLPPPPVLRDIIDASWTRLESLIAGRILDSYENIPPEHRDSYFSLLISPVPAKGLISYVGAQRPNLDTVSGDVLMKLLDVPGRVQYEVLLTLLLRFEDLSANAQGTINNLIANPPSWWVGGAVGQMTLKHYKNLLSDGVADIPAKLVNLERAQLTGALVAEMAQCYFAPPNNLHEQYKPIFHAIIARRDSEIIRYAEEWMDYQLNVFHFSNEATWSVLKARLRELSEGGEETHGGDRELLSDLKSSLQALIETYD